jgi:tetratricopeptide (TPR) repeat protein
MTRFSPLEPTPEQARRITAADAALAAAPDDIERIVEAARAREVVWRYDEAIELWTRGEALAPEDYRFPLGRAHRLMRLRRVDEALADLDRSYELDPYGFNTAYLRALTRYLQGSFADAVDEYARACALAEDENACALADRNRVPGDPRHCMWLRSDSASRIAITAWRYRALRRAGRHDEASKLLETVEDGSTLTAPPEERYRGTIIRPDSNEHYYRCLLFYRGERTEAQILDRDELGGQWATVAYGVAVWHLVEGRRERAFELMNAIVATPHWARLGHVAAESDLAAGA